MKKILVYTVIFSSLVMLAGCSKYDTYGNYPGGTISPVISIYDVRDLYRGTDVPLTKSVLFGSSKISGVVVSDHSGGNLPAGLLILQDKRRLSELRGIAVNIGADATKYIPGDSITITIEGGILKRADGVLQITGLSAAAVTKNSSGASLPVNRVPASSVLANPEKYESTLIVLVKAGFNPLPSLTDVLEGDKMLNDGFGDLTLHTENTATFAKNKPPFLANFYGIVFNKTSNDNTLVPQLRLRTVNDIVVLSSVVNVSPVVISGFISDVNGADGNYEYVQCMATQDINFATTPYSMVFTNNANASTPTGFLPTGWATGGMRTYKINLTTGSVKKGAFFYVGGTAKMINGPSSTNISTANWVGALNYTTANGDGFGTKTTGLLANSGNASGIAVFSGINITGTSVPVDVIFVGSGGSLYTTTPTAMGYRIANTDWYDIKNPVTLEDQPFYRSGSNTLNMAYTTSDIGYFYKLGGEYNVALGRWMKARSQNNVLLTKTSALTEIEGEGSTKLQ